MINNSYIGLYIKIMEVDGEWKEMMIVIEIKRKNDNNQNNEE